MSIMDSIRNIVPFPMSKEVVEQLTFDKRVRKKKQSINIFGSSLTTAEQAHRKVINKMARKSRRVNHK